ncbi:DNA alkylation repair protein [Halobacillus sp. A5]|uniref:DNA alkylation repair protein n=1 Tax=Halobacillus sp. A5 TaxID=2880263 RepID=UPI0020A69281|nr:DNA alkylation repair protein [Halobacillus sp. A5]MCP3026299.1 DNA alkylation repair protein [Halobacillus sp. A5]
METADKLYKEIVTALQENRSEVQRQPMEKYMKNQFSFYGIKTPERKRLLQCVLKKFNQLSYIETLQIVELLYSEKERECHYAALTILSHYKEPIPLSSIGLYKNLITTHSWWDTVDMISSNLCGRYFQVHSDQLPTITKKWAQSYDLWVRRASLLFQLKMKEETDEGLLYDTILTLRHEKEFFIEKAIGWALREYSKTNPASAAAFIRKHPLRPLSRREGLKWIKSKGLDVNL